MRVLTRKLRLYLCALLLSILCVTAAAKEVVLVLSRNDSVHAAFAESFRHSLGAAGLSVRDAGVAGVLNQEAMVEADWVVVAGEAAAEAVLGVSEQGPPVLLALSSLAQYMNLRQRYPARHISAVVLDQPAERHLALISLLLPGAKRVGCLLGPDSESQDAEFSRAAANVGLVWTSRGISSSSELSRTLERVLRDSDVFLALPDALLNTSTAARTILLTSYRYRQPVIGFSRAYVDAGALGAVFSTPEHNGRDSADWIVSQVTGSDVTPDHVWPTRFEVATNPQVARSLQIELDDDLSLRNRLAGRMEASP